MGGHGQITSKSPDRKFSHMQKFHQFNEHSLWHLEIGRPRTGKDGIILLLKPRCSKKPSVQDNLHINM